MSESSGPRRARKAPDRPKKPYPDFPLWTAVTTIVYNLAVAVAAIGSL